MASVIEPLPCDDIQLFLSKMQDLDLHDTWFQQDGVTCHTARVTMDLLREETGQLYV